VFYARALIANAAATSERSLALGCGGVCVHILPLGREREIVSCARVKMTDGWKVLLEAWIDRGLK
jgi:hypothetical protein